MSEIEERQQAPIMVLISSCGLDYAYSQSASGLVACRSMSELMPPVIAVVGTCLVRPHWPWAGHHRRVWRRAAGGHFILYVIIQLRAGMYSAFDISCNARIFFWFFACYVYKIKIEPNFHSFAASIPVRRAHFRPMRISSHQSCKSHSMQKLSMQVY